MVKKIDRFVDPAVVMSPRAGVYWTPNGNHRRTVLTKLKCKVIPAILVPEPEVAFQILALNTEKAHNLKEKSLEVIRMYRGLGEHREDDQFVRIVSEGGEWHGGDYTVDTIYRLPIYRKIGEFSPHAISNG